MKLMRWPFKWSKDQGFVNNEPSAAELTALAQLVAQVRKREPNWEHIEVHRDDDRIRYVVKVLNIHKSNE